MGAAATRVTPAQAVEAARLLLENAGAARDIAGEVALNLVDADMCGHDSHGLRLVATYVELLLSGKASGKARPRIQSIDGAMVKIDGHGAFGQVTGAFAARHGIAQAKLHGIAAVAVSGSGHFGRNGMWPELAANDGVASLHFINAPGAPSSVVPPGGYAARLTSNPAAFGLPCRNDEHIIVDFATGDFSVNAIKLAQERGERLPRASIMREDGTLTDDPAAFLMSRAMLPFGGFKGFGFAVIVELLAGAVTGGSCHRGDGKAGSQNNMLSIYLDITRFTGRDAYEREVDAFLTWLRSGDSEVPVPGSRSRKARESARRSGLVIHPALRQILSRTAERLGAGKAFAAILAPA